MTAADLVATLRARGVALVAAGDRVRFRPVDALTASDRAALVAHKVEVLALLRADAELVVDAVACTPEPCAWRLRSQRLERDLWVARDAEAAAQLDRDGAREGLPVVLAADLEDLRAFDDRRLGNLLDALTVFPGARLAALSPEGNAHA